jgi:hypothetical protein
MLNRSQTGFRATYRQSLRDNESFRAASRALKQKDAEPMRESGMSMRFFKEAFENVSINHGNDSMTTLFAKEKQRADQANAHNRTTNNDSGLLDEQAPLSGAPTSFLKSRRQSARRNNAAETMSQGSYNKTGNRFFNNAGNPAATAYNNKDALGGDIQSIIDGFSQE